MKKLLYSVAIASLLAACGSPSTHLNTKISSTKLAEIAAMSGDAGAATSMLATAAQDNPRDAQAQLDYANALVQQNNISEARRVLASRIGQVRDASLLHGPLGSIYVLTGEAQQAVTEFDAALSSDRSNVRWITNKAIALDLLNRHGEAQALYKQALTSTPNDPIILSNLGLSLALSGQKDEAMRVIAPIANNGDLLPRVKNTIDLVRNDKLGKAG
jgi:Flp pilus assembly protein TadD